MTGDTGLYVWGAYAMALALVLTEIGLLRMRDRTICRYLGWRSGYPPADRDASAEPDPPDAAAGT